MALGSQATVLQAGDSDECFWVGLYVGMDEFNGTERNCGTVILDNERKKTYAVSIWKQSLEKQGLTEAQLGLSLHVMHCDFWYIRLSITFPWSLIFKSVS